MHQLGIVLRRLGFLDISESVLGRAFEKNPTNEAIALSLANLQQQAYRRTVSDYKSTDEPTTQITAVRNGLERASSALSRYHSLAKDLSSDSQVFAGLNWLTLWSSLEPSIPELKQLQQQNVNTASNLIEHLQKILSTVDLRRQPEARLSLAESLLKSNNPLFKGLARQNTDEAIKIASANSDFRLLSRAYGIRGQLMKQNETAITEFGKALSAAQSIRADDLAYKWQWESAKLYKQAGNRDKALKLYAASLLSIKQTREKLLQLNPDIQYDFRDKVEPVYREYLGLLFDTSNPDLKSAIETNNQLQISELENYLQCNLLNSINSLDSSPEKSPDAEIYIIKLPDQYIAIVRKKMEH